MNTNRKRISYVFVFIVLIANFCAFFVAAYYEVNHDFSDSLDVSNYIKNNNLFDEYFVAGYNVEALLPYFDVGSFHCIGFNDSCSFSLGSTKKSVDFGFSFGKFMAEYDGEKQVVVVLGGGTYVDFLESSDCVLLKAFDESISGEDYYVFSCGSRDV